MLLALLLVFAGAKDFREIGVGLPTGDDITELQIDPEGALWVGTFNGIVYRSSDEGQSWLEVFRVPSSEPLVVPQLRNVRTAVALNDLGRGTGRDVEPRDRVAYAQREADLAGDVRDRPRNASSPLLSSLVRPAVRDPRAIGQFAFCGDYTFVISEDGVFRGKKGTDTFVAIDLGVDKTATYMACDSSTPGRLVVTASRMLNESLDWGDSFFPYKNPIPRTGVVDSFGFDEEGRLLALFERKLYRENEDRRGFTKICEFRGDSPEADRVAWAWWLSPNFAFGVTGDGVATCEGNLAGRLPDLRLHDPVSFLWVDEPRSNHIFVATKRTVYESFDGGKTLTEIFTAETPRSIFRLNMTENGALYVVSGGQIWVRKNEKTAQQAYDLASATTAIMQQTPLGEVLATSLSRFDLTPGDLARQRNTLRLRNLMPTVVARYNYFDASNATRNIILPSFRRDLPTINTLNRGLGGNGNVWVVFALWDVGALVFDPPEAQSVWADLERLRARVTYRVQDAYVAWARAEAALKDPELPPRARGALELARREQASYLDKITGGAFPAFSLQ